REGGPDRPVAIARGRAADPPRADAGGRPRPPVCASPAHRLARGAARRARPRRAALRLRGTRAAGADARGGGPVTAALGGLNSRTVSSLPRARHDTAHVL